MAVALRLVSMAQVGINDISLPALHHHRYNHLPLPAILYIPSQHELDYYKKLWSLASTTGSAVISGSEAVAFLLKSGVDRSVLRNIWELCVPPDANHQMNFESFMKSLRIIALAQSGVPVAVPSAPRTKILQNIMAPLGNIELPLPTFEGVQSPSQPLYVAPALAHSSIAAYSPSVNASHVLAPSATPTPRGSIGGISLGPYSVPNTSTTPTIGAVAPFNSLHSNTSVLSSSSLNSWTPYKDEVDVYDKLFDIADVSHHGTVSGAEAVQFFAKSNLPKPLLREIWSIAAANKVSFLERHDFYIAMRLISMAQSNLPAEVGAFLTHSHDKLPLPVFEGIILPVA